jgi:hypothetical protein
MAVATNQPFAEELVAAGVPYEDIVRGFQPVSVCQCTESSASDEL